MNKLSHLFKQVNQIVIEQGPIMDRIDYNLEQSLQNTKDTTKEMQEVKASIPTP
jgi:t-SNARE complex subunit (syntaxin)